MAARKALADALLQLLEEGPFAESRFAKLPERDWTLLVQGLNNYLRSGEKLLQKFNFIPHARLDDLDPGAVGAVGSGRMERAGFKEVEGLVHINLYHSWKRVDDTADESRPVVERHADPLPVNDMRGTGTSVRCPILDLHRLDLRARVPGQVEEVEDARREVAHDQVDRLVRGLLGLQLLDILGLALDVGLDLGLLELELLEPEAILGVGQDDLLEVDDRDAGDLLGPCLPEGQEGQEGWGR